MSEDSVAEVIRAAFQECGKPTRSTVEVSLMDLMVEIDKYRQAVRAARAERDDALARARRAEAALAEIHHQYSKGCRP